MLLGVQVAWARYQSAPGAWENLATFCSGVVPSTRTFRPQLVTVVSGVAS